MAGEGFDTPAALAAVKALVEGLDSPHATYVGEPLKFDRLINAIVTVGGQRSTSKALGGLQRRDMRFLVVFQYRVGDDQETAETTLASLVDQITRAVYEDRTLGGTVGQADPDLSLADTADYETRAGQEFRRYPVVITCKQQDVIASS